MTEAFLPLAARSPGGDPADSFRVQVLAGTTGAAASFQPWSPAPQIVPDPPHQHPDGAQVTLTRSGERITGIRVQCGCGAVIDLQCEY